MPNFVAAAVADWAASAAITAGVDISTATGALYLSVYVAADLAATVALSAASAAIFAPSTPSPEAQRLTIRQTLPERYRGCGHVRMGAPLVL